MDFPAKISREQLSSLSPEALAAADELGITHFVLDETGWDMHSVVFEHQACDLFGHDGDPDEPQDGQRTWWWEPETTDGGAPRWKSMDKLVPCGP